MATTLAFDFMEDLRAHLASELSATGISLDPGKTAEEVAYLWANFQHHKISTKPRNVHWSQELCSSNLNPDQLIGVKRIEAVAQRGGDLNPFLSKRTATPLLKDGSPSTDGMLVDWGITHMHLGPLNPQNLFATRTGALLFVMVRPLDLYLIIVEDHTSFLDQDILEIVHRNWRTVLEPYRAPNVVGFENAFAGGLSSQARLELRKAGITMGVAMADGTFYMAPGGGVTSAGTSANAIDSADQIVQKIKFLGTRVKEHAEDVIQYLESKGVRGTEMRLSLDVATAKISEVSSGTEVPLLVIGLRVGS